MAPLLNSATHITNRSSRRLRRRRRLVDRRLRNGFASEGNGSLFDEQWRGCDSPQGNAGLGHRSTIIAEDEGRSDTDDCNVHLITWDEAQVVCPKISWRCRDTEGH